MSGTWGFGFMVACLVAVILLMPVTRRETVFLDAQGCAAYASLDGSPKAEMQETGCRAEGNVIHNFSTIAINGVSIGKPHVTATRAVKENGGQPAWYLLATFYISLAVFVGGAVLWMAHLYRKSRRGRQEGAA